jgi:hypothetical protein
LSSRDLLEILTQIKDAGNKSFKAKEYPKAIQKFGEGVKLYEENIQSGLFDEEVRTRVTQLVTNRSLSHHLSGN